VEGFGFWVSGAKCRKRDSWVRVLGSSLLRPNLAPAKKGFTRPLRMLI